MSRGLDITILAPPLTRSLYGNTIGEKGASALAAVLKKTRISQLKCAAFAFVSAPVDTSEHLLPYPRSQSARQRPRSRRSSRPR